MVGQGRRLSWNSVQAAAGAILQRRASPPIVLQMLRETGAIVDTLGQLLWRPVHERGIDQRATPGCADQTRCAAQTIHSPNKHERRLPWGSCSGVTYTRGESTRNRLKERGVTSAGLSPWCTIYRGTGKEGNRGQGDGWLMLESVQGRCQMGHIDGRAPRVHPNHPTHSLPHLEVPNNPPG